MHPVYFNHFLKTLEETKQDIEDSINKNHIELISKAIEPIKPTSTAKAYLHGIIQSIIGAFAFMIIMCAIVFIVHLSTHKFTITVGGEGSTRIQQSDSTKVDTIAIRPLSK